MLVLPSPLEIPPAILPISQQQADQRFTEACLSIARIRGNCAIETLQRLLESQHVAQKIAPVAMRIDVVGCDRDRGIIACKRLLHPAELDLHIAAIAMSFGVSRLELDGPRVTRERRLRSIESLEHVGTAQVRLGIAGPDRNGLVVARQRVLEALQFEQGPGRG